MKIMNKPFPQKCTISNDEYTVDPLMVIEELMVTKYLKKMEI